MGILAQIVENNEDQAGELQDGFLAASIKNIGQTTAVVNGVYLEPGEAKGYPFVGKGYNKITYDPDGGTLRIMQIL